jgi:hypothetical protein
MIKHMNTPYFIVLALGRSALDICLGKARKSTFEEAKSDHRVLNLLRSPNNLHTVKYEGDVKGWSYRLSAVRSRTRTAVTTFRVPLDQEGEYEERQDLAKAVL